MLRRSRHGKVRNQADEQGQKLGDFFVREAAQCFSQAVRWPDGEVISRGEFEHTDSVRGGVVVRMDLRKL